MNIGQLFGFIKSIPDSAVSSTLANAERAEAAAEEAKEAADTFETDKTLSIPDMSPDSKVVGDNITDLKSAIDETTERYSKNLFDKEHPNIINAAPTTSAPLKYSSNSNARTVWIECKPNTTYTVSKQAGARFTVAYGAVIPEINAEIEVSKHYETNSSITVTTSSTAKYLGAFVWLSTTDVITFEEMLATVQIEEGDTATPYQPYTLTAYDKFARKKLSELNETVTSEELDILSSITSASLGSEMVSDFSDMTAIGNATYSNGVWHLPVESGIQTNITIEANKTYLIELGVVARSVVISDYSTNYKVNPLTITLGDASLSIFANNDANWKLCLTPTVSGSVPLSIECEDLLTLSMESLSVKKVLNYVDIPAHINNVDTYMNNRNIGIGGGQKKRITGDYNVAIGINAQRDIDTGYANVGIGYSSQKEILNGRANCAVGNRAQEAIKTGMYNNAFGTVSQGNITSGCWNNAFGNETQRDMTTGHNNTAMGRRAQSYLTTGCMNVAIGSFSGFARIASGGTQGDHATTTASYQTLVGGETIQASTDPQDYATAFGYRSMANEKATALGPKAEATGENSIAIGFESSATNDDEIVIGTSAHQVVKIAGKTISFNQDGTVTWS